MSYGLKKEVIQKINSIFLNHKEIAKVILYGSRAKGSYKDGSDIDLSIFSEVSLSISQLHRIELELDDLLLPYMIDISIYDRLKNEDLKEHIFRVGKLFYQKEKQ